MESLDIGRIVSMGVLDVSTMEVEDLENDILKERVGLSEESPRPPGIENEGRMQSSGVISHLLDNLSSLQQGHLKFGRDLKQCEEEAERLAEAFQRLQRTADPVARLAPSQANVGGREALLPQGHSPGSLFSTASGSGHGDAKQIAAVTSSRGFLEGQRGPFFPVLPCSVADDPAGRRLAAEGLSQRSLSKPTPIFKTATTDDLITSVASQEVIRTESKPAFKRGNNRALLPHAAFSNFSIEDMKAQVREATTGKTYNTFDYYRKDSVWAKLAMNDWFDNITLVTICLNSLWLAVETDQNDAVLLKESGAWIQTFEHFFCTFFLAEWLVRFLAYKYKRDCLRDTSFIFDGFLVILAITETWILTIFSYVSDFGKGASALRLVRLARLTRMARISRVVRAMPELMILIKGILVATRSVFFTLLLLVILIYVFAIAFTQLAKDEDAIRTQYFSSVSESMVTLMVAGAMPDLAQQLDDIRSVSPLVALVYMLFVLMSSLTLMNMLIGVLVEVVTEVSRVEKARLDFSFVMDKLSTMVNCGALDQNGDNMISRAEFATMLTTPMCARTLKDVGVDVVGLVDCIDFIFEGVDEMSFVKFMEVIMQLRGSNTATVRDVVDMKKVLKSEIFRLSHHMEIQFEKIAARLGIPIEKV